jgi:hypothetical protein
MICACIRLVLAVVDVTPTATQQIQQINPPSEQYATANPSISPKQGEPDQRPKKEESGESDSSWLLQFLNKYSNALNAISALIIAAFTIALFYTSKWLWQSGEKHSERELRAYVSVTPDRVFIDADKAQITGLKCVVKNHGRTPAFEINFLYGISILPKGAELPAATEKISENAAIFPDAHLNTVFCKPTFTSEEITKVIKGTHRLHVWGKQLIETPSE